jgi:hypothetical protein
MRAYLVVANKTLAGGQLLATLHELAAHAPTRFHVVVPAEPPRGHSWTESEARAAAHARLDAALERFRDAGLEVDGEVGDEHPVEAVGDVLLRGETFEGVVLSTLPSGPSRWLKLDLVSRIQGAFGLPVIHVIGHEEPVPGE